MRKYIAIFFILVSIAAFSRVEAWDWSAPANPSITIAADSTDCGSTLVDTSRSGVIPVNRYEMVRVIVKAYRDTVFANDTLFVRFRAIDTDSRSTANIDTAVYTITLDSLNEGTLGRVGAIYQFQPSDSTWFGYYYIEAIYKFDLGTTADDSALAGATYEDSLCAYGMAVPKWEWNR